MNTAIAPERAAARSVVARRDKHNYAQMNSTID
jgi:hypothetical protein